MNPSRTSPKTSRQTRRYIAPIQAVQPSRTGDIKRMRGHDGVVGSRIMYIECKAASLSGAARIGRVTFSKSRRTLYYGEQELRRLPGGGYKTNHYDVATGEDYWVSGPKKDGGDRLYGERVPVHVDADADADVREEYWTAIRALPHRATDDDASR